MKYNEYKCLETVSSFSEGDVYDGYFDGNDYIIYDSYGEGHVFEEEDFCKYFDDWG